ncbi:Ig-like domain-containing protein [Cystobacter fuscus]|uniref:Ig-like domain-containing protein n=1 Tax=Cystobacter fuscus TaxID=43 RepID=UPI0012FD36FA|nr:Ig-like domain-containing protein [Cystobacter fuscus]
MSAPFDIGAVIRQVRLAYRQEGAGWRGGRSTYDVRADGDGLTLTPVRPETEPVRGGSLKLGTARLARGDVPVGTELARAHVEQDGHLSFTHDGYVEHLRNGEQDVEQSWRFEQAPAGEGDLLLRIPVEGLTFNGVTGSGLHFADGKTGLGVRYGHVSWVEEASGRRTLLEAEHAQGQLQVRVPSGLLASSAYPAALTTSISPEMGLDEPVPTWEPSPQKFPRVASNGTDYLVVWADERNASGSDIYGARVSGTGEVMDIAGLAISTAPERQYSPAVAFDGTDYLVVWTDERNLATTKADLYGTRVTSAGVVVTPSGLAISTAAGDQNSPMVASNGTDFFVVWTDERNLATTKADLYGTRVTSAGVVVTPSGLAISTATGDQYGPAVASNGTDYFVVWEDKRTGVEQDIYGTRVTNTDTVISPSGLALTTATGGQYSPSVASNGADYLVVWESAEDDIEALRVTGSGGVEGPPRIILNSSESRFSPEVTSNGTDYLVVWGYGSSSMPVNWGVGGARVTSTGEAVGIWSLGIYDHGRDSQLQPTVASDGTSYFVVWMDPPSTVDNRFNVYGRRVVDGDVGMSLVRISTSANAQEQPAVASNGTDFLVVWEDQRGSDFDLYGTRVSGTGTVLDPSGLILSNRSSNQLYPSVASNGTDYLVVWQDFAGSALDIRGRRVTSTGVMPDDSDLLISTSSGDQRIPKVASNGTDYLVVWNDDRAGGTNTDVYGTRVKSTGEILDPSGIPIGTSPLDQEDTAVASNGTDYFVVWVLSVASTNRDIQGARVTSTGAVLDASGLVLSATPTYKSNPAVASHGTDYLVVWADRSDGTTSDIHGTRVKSTGEVLDPSGLAVCKAANEQATPALAFNGEEYLVTWSDKRNDTDWNLQATRVLTTGEVLEPTGLLISGEPGAEMSASLAVNPQRKFFVVYSRFDASPGFGSERIRARFVSFSHPPRATPQRLTTSEDLALALTLSGFDPDGDTLTFAVVSSPSHGTLSGTPPRLTYTPAADFHGTDAFTFTVSDGETTSSPATLDLDVMPVSDAPWANALSLSLHAGETVPMTLTGSDADGDSLTFALTSHPEGGVLAGTPPSLTFTPDWSFRGRTSFTFTASDGSATSEPATVTLDVVNRAPQATFSVNNPLPYRGQLVGFTASASDPDGDALTYRWDFGDASPQASGASASHTYAAPGRYTVTLTVTDAFSTSVSETSTVEILNRGNGSDGPKEPTSGCGCMAGTGSGAEAFLGLVLLTGLTLRRRRPRGCP